LDAIAYALRRVAVVEAEQQFPRFPEQLLLGVDRELPIQRRWQFGQYVDLVASRREPVGRGSLLNALWRPLFPGFFRNFIYYWGSGSHRIDDNFVGIRWHSRATRPIGNCVRHTIHRAIPFAVASM
jgi:hypothetical protein